MAARFKASYLRLGHTDHGGEGPLRQLVLRSIGEHLQSKARTNPSIRMAESA
jgi:hypothetical protein